MNQLDYSKKPISSKRKRALIINFIILVAILIVGNILAAIFHLPRHNGLFASIIIFLAIIPLCNMLYIGAKQAGENERLILKFFLILFICTYILFSVGALIINIIHTVS